MCLDVHLELHGVYTTAKPSSEKIVNMYSQKERKSQC